MDGRAHAPSQHGVDATSKGGRAHTVPARFAPSRGNESGREWKGPAGGLLHGSGVAGGGESITIRCRTLALHLPPRLNRRQSTRRHMSRAVWLKADDTVGDWEQRKRRITAGLEAGSDAAFALLPVADRVVGLQPDGA